MKLKNYILTLILFLLFACIEKKPSHKTIKKVGTTTIIDNAKKLNIKYSKNYNVIIVTTDYDFENNFFGINLNIFSGIGDSLNSAIKSRKLNKFNDPLMHGKYNTSGAYYPVQFDLSQNKLYLSVYKADEYEGFFDYNKILEYNLINDSIKEVTSFKDYFSSWYFSTIDSKIYGFDNVSKSIISVDVHNSQIDTLYKSLNYYEDIEYHPVNDHYLDIITFNRETGVEKLRVDLKTGDISLANLYPIKSFSSSRKGIVIETFKDFKTDIEELRLYNGSIKKSIPFDFKNFNTHWINDSTFLAIKTNEIQKINTDLEIIETFKREKIHIIDVSNNSILISYFDDGNEKVGLINHNFEKFVEIPNIKAQDIVLFKDEYSGPNTR